MPKEIEDRLRREAEENIHDKGKFKSVEEHRENYVQGTLHNIEKKMGRKKRRKKHG